MNANSEKIASTSFFKTKSCEKKNCYFTAVDLFSGCGGLTQGLKNAGFTVIGAIEIDSLAVETYKDNHPGIHVWEKDIKKVSIAQVKRILNLKSGELDLLAGCPPCQGFSMMRTLNGNKTVEDPRNELVFEFLRFVRGLRPKAIMMENVPGLASDIRIVQLCNELTTLGYTYRLKILNAAEYGVPQRRYRMILLGSRFGPVDFAPVDRERKTVRQTIGYLQKPGRSGDSIHDLPEKRKKSVMDIIQKIPRDGGSRRDLGKDRQLDCHKKCDGFKDVYGRMAWDDVSPTITSGCVNPSKGRFLHPEQDRAITLREAALLQSFPSNYRFSLKRGKYRVAVMIGNALPPEFIKRHANQIYIFLKAKQNCKRKSKQKGVS
ncbi:MAG: DNA cytosine methyltransferase [Bacillota bacterium]